MSKSLRLMVLGLAAVLVLGVAASAQKKQATGLKNKYANIEIVRFEIKEGVEKFSADWLITMTEELYTQLKQTGKFKEVLREGETPTEAAAPTIKLTGIVTEFNPGSRAARYLVGFGAGSTKIKAHIKILDSTTNEVLFEDDVDGKVVMGAMGGESVGATRGLAKEVASKTKKVFF
jgi:curli biogenesis system outer membrane secretion channel CsgG